MSEFLRFVDVARCGTRGLFFSFKEMVWWNA